MRLSRQTRFIAALIALVGMLFAQLAVAAYACPSEAPVQAAEMTSQATMHGHMEGCAESRNSKSALCKAHCQPDTQSLDRPATVDIPPFVAIAQMSAALAIVAPAQTPVSRRDDLVLQRTTAPPLSIQNCCFRI